MPHDSIDVDRILLSTCQNKPLGDFHLTKTDCIALIPVQKLPLNGLFAWNHIFMVMALPEMNGCGKQCAQTSMTTQRLHTIYSDYMYDNDNVI